MSTASRFLPFLRWLPLLDRPTVHADVAAGMTTATMLVPQAMAYALLAGLPPEVGLYSSIIPLFAYAVFGTSRQLAVGPAAISSLLTAAGLAGLVAEGSIDYLQAAALLAVMVGVIRAALGVARLGFLVAYLGHTVLVGFTAAAALIIGFSQAKHALGIELPRTDGFLETVSEVIRHASEAKPVTMLLTASCILGLVALKRVMPRLPAALVVVVVSIAAVKLFGLEARGVHVVGEIPRSLPRFVVPTVDAGRLGDLAGTAIIISIVGFMESIAVAKLFARRNNYEVDANSELIGLGAANVAAGFFGGYPVNGGLGRTAVNASAGARTPLASIVTGTLVLITVAFLTPLFSSLPNAALAAIIIKAVIGLIDVTEIRRIAVVKPSDLIGLGVAFFGTLLLGVELGIATGVASSLLVVAWRRLVGDKSAPQPDEGESDAHLVPLAGVLSFVNARTIKDELAAQRGAYVIVDLSAVSDVDAVAADSLGEAIAELRARGIAVHFAGARPSVLGVLDRSQLFLSHLPFPTTSHPTIHAARLFLEHAGVEAGGSQQERTSR